MRNHSEFKNVTDLPTYRPTDRHGKVWSRVSATKNCCISRELGDEDGIVSFEVHNNLLETKTTEQVQAVSFEQVIGNAGGLFGLWLGASVLTIMEVFEFVTDSFYCFLYGAKKRLRKVSCARKGV